MSGLDKHPLKNWTALFKRNSTTESGGISVCHHRNCLFHPKFFWDRNNFLFFYFFQIKTLQLFDFHEFRWQYNNGKFRGNFSHYFRTPRFQIFGGSTLFKNCTVDHILKICSQLRRKRCNLNWIWSLTLQKLLSQREFSMKTWEQICAFSWSWIVWDGTQV